MVQALTLRKDGKGAVPLAGGQSPVSFIRENIGKLVGEAGTRDVDNARPGSERNAGNTANNKTHAQGGTVVEALLQGGTRAEVQRAVTVFPTLRCFQAINVTVLTALARVAHFRYFPPGADGNDILVKEDSSESEFLWVLEQGSLTIEEQGETLGTIEAGALLGLSVVLNRTERQPLTARRDPNQSLSAWCIPHAAVCSTLRQSPDAKLAFEDVHDRQIRRLLVRRVAKTAFFSHCSKHFFQPLQGQMKLESHKRGSVLYSAGDAGDSMLVLVRGWCQLMPASLSNRRFATSEIRRRTHGTTPHIGDARSRALAELAKIREDRPSDETGTGSDSEDCASSASASSGFCSLDEKVQFTLPVSKVCLEPGAEKVNTRAGPAAVVFGDGAVLGFQDLRPCTLVAASDCILFVISKHLFSISLKLHPQETRHFEQMAHAQYQEWMHCGLRFLLDIDMFSQCSAPFLSALAEVAQPRLYFPGSSIIAEGSAPDGLFLLMDGTVEQLSEERAAVSVGSPHSFGPLQFLGATLPCEPLRASAFCQVLYLSRQDLLGCLKLHPEESTAMVTQVLRHNGRRVSLVRSSFDVKGGEEPVLELNLWHLPFCNGRSPHFIEALTKQLELVKIVPGQPVFRTGYDAELLVVLLKGKVCVRSSFAPDTELKVPFLLCGRNRDLQVEATAMELCDLHRLSIEGCDGLAQSYPHEMRRFLDCTMDFQSRVHAQMNYPWWQPCAALRYQSVFAASQEAFLLRVAEQMTREIYMPGDKLVLEGSRVDSTMIIECGQAAVHKIDHRVTATVSTTVVAEVKDGFWIGGVGGICGFAGELRRSASIFATTVCKVHRLMNSVFVDLLSGFPEERHRFRQIAESKLQGSNCSEAEGLEEHDFFRSLSRDLRNLLRPKCRPLVFFANEAIMRQGEPADSLFILGSYSDVIIEVDDEKIRELKGCACLGILALLSKWPVKRASTVVTRTACSVRSLSRSDWLEALQHYPEHRRWIEAFTLEQLERVGKARSDFQRKKAWDKIQLREDVASRLHSQRMAFSSSRPGSRSSSMPQSGRSQTGGNFARRAGSTTPRPAHPLQESSPLENWDCFNGNRATVPHTRLPQLGGIAQHGVAVVKGDAALREGESGQQEGGKGRRRTVDIWHSCERAISSGE